MMDTRVRGFVVAVRRFLTDWRVLDNLSGCRRICLETGAPCDDAVTVCQ